MGVMRKSHSIKKYFHCIHHMVFCSYTYRKWKSLSCVRLVATPWTIQFMEFSRIDSRPGQGSLSLLQGIFPTQESNLGLLHCGQILYHLSHKRGPRTVEWVAFPFSSWSSLSRNPTGVSCIAGRFFTNWAIREALILTELWVKWNVKN